MKHIDFAERNNLGKCLEVRFLLGRSIQINTFDPREVPRFQFGYSREGAVGFSPWVALRSHPFLIRSLLASESEKGQSRTRTHRAKIRCFLPDAVPLNMPARSKLPAITSAGTSNSAARNVGDVELIAQASSLHQGCQGLLRVQTGMSLTMSYYEGFGLLCIWRSRMSELTGQSPKCLLGKTHVLCVGA